MAEGEWDQEVLLPPWRRRQIEFAEEVAAEVPDLRGGEALMTPSGNGYVVAGYPSREDGMRIEALRQAVITHGPLGIAENIVTAAEAYAAFLLTEERLPDPEPEYLPGDIWTDPDGTEWKRTPDGRWLCWGVHESFDHEHPERPLALLVRDGKAVASDGR